MWKDQLVFIAMLYPQWRSKIIMSKAVSWNWNSSKILSSNLKFVQSFTFVFEICVFHVVVVKDWFVVNSFTLWICRASSLISCSVAVKIDHFATLTSHAIRNVLMQMQSIVSQPFFCLLGSQLKPLLQGFPLIVAFCTQPRFGSSEQVTCSSLLSIQLLTS